MKKLILITLMSFMLTGCYYVVESSYRNRTYNAYDTHIRYKYNTRGIYYTHRYYYDSYIYRYRTPYRYAKPKPKPIYKPRPKPHRRHGKPHKCKRKHCN